jgi:death-on-curing protein
MVRYLTLSELIYINGRLLNNDKIMSGKQKVRDIVLLESAVLRPSTSAFGEDAYPTLSEKVAALLHSIARNHPFTDGNKRTATVAAIFMFAVNGQRVVWDQAAALSMILAVAENRRDLSALAAWFPLQADEAIPEPDAEKDMKIIDQIINAQRWLLEELSQR